MKSRVHRFARMPECPHCLSRNTKHNSTDLRIQWRRCRDCGKSFKNTKMKGK
jgi:transposase-like protein